MTIRILGIESTCDDTSVALVRDGRFVEANLTASQFELHERFGGVVPEIASRAHLEAIFSLLEKLKTQTGLDLATLDGVAVSNRPGLIGSLLVGLSTARGIAYALEKPLLTVNHIQAHLYAAFLEMSGADETLPPKLAYPFLGLVVSGGHTTLYVCKGPCDMTIVASTRDDAAGEAFDKGASLLGLPQPGGPNLEAAAREGTLDTFYDRLPDVRPPKESLDPSFSGIKTALLYLLQGSTDGKRADRRVPEGKERADLAAAYQERIVEALLAMASQGLARFGLSRLVVAGGVAANGCLRKRFEQRALGFDRRGRKKLPPFELFFPTFKFCTDNGAMAAGLGCRLFERGEFAPLDVEADPTPLRPNL